MIAGEGLPVEVACRVLDVSSAGFYAWRCRPLSARAVRHAWLTDLIREVHTASYGSYTLDGVSAGPEPCVGWTSMAAPADRWVSESRLREMLARQGEAYDLDYKSILDIQNDPRHRLKLVKLTAAMTGLGGDIVIGVNPRGVPTGQISGALAQVYDEANLRQILLRYLPPELRVHSQTHDLDGAPVILVHVEPAEGGPLALTRDGVYQEQGGQPSPEFRAGERYIREGTSNTLFTGSEHQVRLLLTQRASAPPAADPADAMSFDIAPGELASAARELLRRADDVPLRGLLDGAGARVRRALEQDAWEEVHRILDRLLVLGCVYVSLSADAQAREVIETLHRVFEIGFEESDVRRQAFNARSPRLWLAIASRAEILGALALRLRRWELVREIGLWRPPQVGVSYVESWIRAAMTTRSHESWPRHEDQQHTTVGVPEVAAEIAETLPQASEDIAGDAERLRTSIGQFDFAVGLMSIAELGNAEPQVLMTDGTHVVGREGLTGFLRQIFAPGPARNAVFPLPDADLALALQRFAHSMLERGHVSFGWYGDTDAFIDQHYPREQQPAPGRSPP